jgi:hypothetical protein
MILPRNRWPEATRDFLADQSTVTVAAVAVCALRSPSGFPVEDSAVTWIRQALSSLKWREAKGGGWRRPAKA